VRAFVIRGPHDAAVEIVEPPVAAPGLVVVEVHRVGVCGTDLECFTGAMAYVQSGVAAYPLRIGHEWCGRILEVGEGVDPGLVGTRTTGDTMLVCGRCERCLDGRGHVCAQRAELGLRGGWPGALAERLAVPAGSLHLLPDEVDDVAGALVEPGANALRAAWAAEPRAGRPVLVLGAGTIGLLTAWFCAESGAEVHVVARSERSRAFARTMGLRRVWAPSEIPPLPWDAVIDATNDPSAPAQAVGLVEPGRRVVLVGLAGEPSLVDTRTIALEDITVVGILGGSAGLDVTIERYASGAVDPRPLVGSTIALEELAGALEAMVAGRGPADRGPTGDEQAGPTRGPKLHIDPRRRDGGAITLP
jgi:2-desacetyl-2-hydroxyethyl bacteriochlorophyllide A dehydrogenase